MITLEWVKETDKLIQLAEKAQLKTINGDVLIAKQLPAQKTKGGIIIPEKAVEHKIDGYMDGFGRIIQLPSSGFASTQGVIECPKQLRVGDFIIFNHASRYKPQPRALNVMFDTKVEEERKVTDHNDEFHDRGQLFFIPFPDIKMVKPLSRVLEILNASSS